ncbi:MAG TPA: nucleotide exchange factor GrpE [Roseiflexaceae bacterium]
MNGRQEQPLVEEPEATAASEAPAQESAAGDGQVPNEELQARVAQLEKQSEDYRDKWLRAAADYKNFKRRADQERVDLIRGASAGLLLKLLPVVDDIERALDSVPDEIAASTWFEGVRLIAQKLQTVLESEGVTPISALGTEFDPNQHEAVIYEDAGDGADAKVVAELQKGYKLRDRVLRPTMVKVGKA